MRRSATPWGSGLSQSRSVFWLAFAAFALLSTLWTLASPLFSVPDENAHVAKAVAQVHGQVIGEAVEGRKHLVVELPQGYDYNHGIMCYLFAPERSAACAAHFGDGTGAHDFATWVGTYNPIYYQLVGWPSLLTDNGTVAVYAMRIMSALLCSVLLAWAFQLAVASARARWMPFGIAFLGLPMIVYLAGSVNPNGVEIAAGAALWVSVLRLLEHLRGSADPLARPRWYLWFVVTVAAVFVADARSIGPLWVLVVAVACVAAVGWKPVRVMFRTPGSYPWLAVIVAACAFSAVWTVTTGGVSSQADATDAPFVGASPIVGVFAMLRRTGDWTQQAMGFFGWLDTPLPGETYHLIVVALGVLVILAATGTDRRGAFVVIGSLAIALFVPALVQGLQIGRTGLIWQGRYSLILYVMIPIAAAWVLSGRRGDRLAFLSSKLTALGVTFVGVFSMIAYVWVMRRYVHGLPKPGAPAGAPSVEWQPPLGDVVLVTSYVVVVAVFSVWIWRLSVLAARADDIGTQTTVTPSADLEPSRV